MKKTIIVLLILVLLFLNIGHIAIKYDKIYGKETVTGEIMRVDYAPNIQTSQHQKYYVFLKPLGVDGGEDWIHFIITNETDCESEYSYDYNMMPELAVGNIVQIVYKKNELKTGNYYIGYETLSVIKTEGENLREVENPEFPLKVNDQADDESYSELTEGTVVHVAKVDSPERGYIIYVDNYTGTYFYTLGRYWFDEDSEGYSKIEEMMDEGLVGKTVVMLVENQFVFYNRNIQKGHDFRLK